MRQELRFLAFGEMEDEQLHRLTQKIAKVNTDAFAKQPCEVFRQKRPMLEGLSQAFTAARVVLLVVQKEQYLSVKEVLLSAMGLTGELDGSIRQIIAGNWAEEELPEDWQLHAVLPAGAQAFPSEDGLWSGFAVKEKEQYFLYLPAQESLLDTLMQNGLHEYLTKLFPQQQGEEKVQQKEETETLPRVDKPIFVGDAAQTVVSQLFAAGVDVAIAQTSGVQAFLRCVELVTGYEKVFTLVETAVDKAELSRKKHIALLAKTARQEGNSTLGVALSGVFAQKTQEEDAQGDIFLYIGIADATHVRVLKVYGMAQEDPHALLEEAVEQLFSTLLQYAQDQGFSLPFGVELAQGVNTQNRSALTYVLLGAIAIVLCLLIAVLVRANGGQGVAAGNMLPAHGLQYHADSFLNPDAIPANAQTQEDTQAPPFTAQELEDAMERQLAQQVQEDARRNQDIGTVPAEQKPATTSLPTKQATVTKATTNLHTTVLSTQRLTTKRSTATAPPGTTRVPTQAQDERQGLFSFTTYGYGHGVGMSQEGAIALARQGKSCEQILKHYFDLSLVKDTSTPKKVNYSGVSYDLAEYLAKTAQAEIGGSSAPEAALQAQILVAYTFAKQRGFAGLNATKHAFSTKTPSAKTMQAVYEVLGMQDGQDPPQGRYLVYQGKAAMTPYFASAAGKTTSVSSVWGGSLSSYPYLAGGVASPEQVSIVTKSLSSEQIRQLVEDYNQSDSCIQKITLQKDPGEWIKIMKHDASVNSKVGYIEQIRIGNVTMTGNHFRYFVLDTQIRSHCFTVRFQEET